MNTIIVWLLVSVSNSGNNYGTLTVVGKFPTVENCEFVQKNLPASTNIQARCIQATLVKE